MEIVVLQRMDDWWWTIDMDSEMLIVNPLPWSTKSESGVPNPLNKIGIIGGESWSTGFNQGVKK